MIQLQEKQRKLTGLRQELDGLIEVKSTAPDAERTAFKNEELPRRQAEIKSLHEDIQSDTEMLEYAERNRREMKSANAPNYQSMFGGEGSQEQRDPRSVGQRFVESDLFKNRSSDLKSAPIEAKFALDVREWQDGGADPAIKATLSTTSGFAPFIPRGPRVVPLGQIQPVISDLIDHTPTTVPGGKYMEETTYTNAAGIVPEGTIKPEAALAFTERLFGMQKVAVSIPVTDEQLEDVPQIRGIIDNRLSLMVRQKNDDYLLNNTIAGGGAYDGFLQKTGVQAVPMGADPLPTAVLTAMTQIEFQPGFATVTALIMNPLDWRGYATYQISTGAYLVGSPDTSAITTMWGMPIIRTNRMPQGTALLGDFRTYAEILDRENLTIRLGWANDDFLKNLQRVLAEARNTLNIYRATAFAKVTGITFA